MFLDYLVVWTVVLNTCILPIQTELFGGDLSSLVSSENSVPPLVDKLIQDIESRGKSRYKTLNHFVLFFKST